MNANRYYCGLLVMGGSKLLMWFTPEYDRVNQTYDMPLTPLPVPPCQIIETLDPNEFSEVLIRTMIINASVTGIFAVQKRKDGIYLAYVERPITDET